MHTKGQNEGNAFVTMARALQTYYPWCFCSIFTFFYFVWQLFLLLLLLLLLLVFLAIDDAILETVFKVNGNKRPIELGRLNLFPYRHTRPTDLIELKWILWGWNRWTTTDWKASNHFCDNRSVRASLLTRLFSPPFRASARERFWASNYPIWFEQ